MALHLSGQAPQLEGVTVTRSPRTSATVVDPLANGRFVASNATVRNLLARAYGLHDSQLLKVPAWAGTDRFDIEAHATAVPPEGPEALLPAVRDMLTRYFGLRAHLETREMPAYVLTVKEPGRLGPRMRATQADCSPGRRPLTSEEIRALAMEGGWPPCGLVFVNVDAAPGLGSAPRNRVRRSAITAKDLAIRFQDNLDAPVIDRTALASRFDVEYTFASPAGDRSPFVAAIDEQLGLTLVRQRVAVPVLVIDRVKRPFEG